MLQCATVWPKHTHTHTTVWPRQTHARTHTLTPFMLWLDPGRSMYSTVLIKHMLLLWFHFISALLLPLLHRGVCFLTHLCKSLSQQQQDQSQESDVCSSQNDTSSWGYMMQTESAAFLGRVYFSTFLENILCAFHMELYALTHFLYWPLKSPKNSLRPSFTLSLEDNMTWKL